MVGWMPEPAWIEELVTTVEQTHGEQAAKTTRILIDATAADPTVAINLRQSDYLETFFLWTVAFGLIMDIPWLIIVVVRTGLVTPQQIAKGRKISIIVNLLAAAMITPGSDMLSLFALFVPMQLLFEGGLFASRFFGPKAAPAIESEPES